MSHNWVNFQFSIMKKLWDLAHEIGGLCIIKRICKNGILHIIMKRGCKTCLHTYLLGTLIFYNEDTQKFLDKLGGGSH